MAYSAADFAADVTGLMCSNCPKVTECEQDLQRLYQCVESAVERSELYRLL